MPFCFDIDKEMRVFFDFFRTLLKKIISFKKWTLVQIVLFKNKNTLLNKLVLQYFNRYYQVYLWLVF